MVRIVIKLVQFISDNGVVCSIACHYSVNAVGQQALKDRFIQTLISNTTIYSENLVNK